MCYPLLIPTLACEAYGHILSFRLGWRQCDKIASKADHTLVCLHKDREKNKPTVIETTNPFCWTSPQPCGVCTNLFERRSDMECMNKKVKRHKAEIAGLEVSITTFTTLRDSALTAVQTGDHRFQPAYDDCAARIAKYGICLRNLEADVATLVQRIKDASHVYLRGEVNNALPKFQNIGMVNYLYFGPLGDEEIRTRANKPSTLPPMEWVQRELHQGLWPISPKWEVPQPPLRSVETPDVIETTCTTEPVTITPVVAQVHPIIPARPGKYTT